MYHQHVLCSLLRYGLGIMLHAVFCMILLTSLSSVGLCVTKAGGDQASGAQEVSADDPLGRSTPRGTALGFMKAMNRGEYERAIQYLDTKQPRKQAEKLVRQLQMAIDRKLSGDLGDLSSEPEGDLEDGLSPNREKVGTVKTDSVSLDVLLDRVRRGDDPPIWLFSSETLKHLPEIRECFGAPLAERYLPPLLTQKRVLGVPAWRWIAFFVVIMLMFLVTLAVTRLLTPVLKTLLGRFIRDGSERSVERIRNPFRLFIMALTVYAYVPLSYSALGRLFWIRVAETLTVISLTWFCLRVIDVIMGRAARNQRNLSSGTTAVTRLFGQLGKGLAVTTGAAIILYQAGFNLTAVLTGLGIGGVAIAFAAQKTLENLFGGIMIVSDKPVRVGDFIAAGQHRGVVEDIGLRSTRLRTVDRTIVSVPNGQISTIALENFTMRDKIPFRHTVSLKYETSGDQLRYILVHIRKLLDEHPHVESDTSRVRLIAIGKSSFDLEIFAYVLVTAWETFLEVQEDLLLSIVDIVEDSGTALA